MVDHGRVRRLLDRLRLETDRLRRLADRPTEELLNDEVALGSAQFRFLLAIEVCVGFLAVSSGFGDQVGVVPAWRVDEGVMVSLAA
jgi:hypothetical protein